MEEATGGNLTRADIEDVIEAVSIRLLQDDGPATERPRKHRRLASVSDRNPKPAPDALPDVTWSAWADLAGEMGLNSSHGPGLVHSIARLYAERIYAALTSQQPSQGPLLSDVDLQQLNAMLQLAQGAQKGSGLGETGQLQQSEKRHEAALPSGGSGARQPLQQRWPDGLASATQLMGSQADELVAVGTVPFEILGKGLRARGSRGKEDIYLVQFQGIAAGEEDWVSARKLRKKVPGGAAIIAEYERALEAGELEWSQQQSPGVNPGASARASQQSQQAAPSLPAIPEAASHQTRSASADPSRQRERRRQQQQPETKQKRTHKTRDPRLPRRSAARLNDAGQASQQPPDQQAAAGPAAPVQQPAATATLRCQGDAAAAGAGQSQAPSHVKSQPPTDSQWLALDTQTQPPVVDAPVAMDYVPLTQGSQPAQNSNSLHRQPLPAQPAAAAAPAAAESAPTGPAAGAAAAAAAPQAAPAPSVAAAPEPPQAPSAAPAAATADAAAPDTAQPASGQAIPQDGKAASGSDEDSAPPDPKTQRGVLNLLRRLSSSAVSPAHRAQLQPAPQQQQQPPSLAQPAVKLEQHQGQQAVPQQHGALSGAAAAGDASGESTDEDDEASKLKAHLQPHKWAGARITGARKYHDGMDITVVWDEDGYKASIANETLKAEVHCRLKLIEFYESKIKAVARKSKK